MEIADTSVKFEVGVICLDIFDKFFSKIMKPHLYKTLKPITKNFNYIIMDRIGIGFVQFRFSSERIQGHFFL